jgi:hypothetical protein
MPTILLTSTERSRYLYLFASQEFYTLALSCKKMAVNFTRHLIHVRQNSNANDDASPHKANEFPMFPIFVGAKPRARNCCSARKSSGERS